MSVSIMIYRIFLWINKCICIRCERKGIALEFLWQLNNKTAKYTRAMHWIYVHIYKIQAHTRAHTHIQNTHTYSNFNNAHISDDLKIRDVEQWAHRYNVHFIFNVKAIERVHAMPIKSKGNAPFRNNSKWSTKVKTIGANRWNQP